MQVLQDKTTCSIVKAEQGMNTSSAMPPPINCLDTIEGTIIQPSPIHGHGLFAVVMLEANEVLTVLDGQIIPYEACGNQALSLEWNALEGDLLLVRAVPTKYRYINHSRTPNLEVIVNGESPYPMLRLKTLKTIEPGVELLLDYRKEPLPKAYQQGHGATYL